MKTYNNIRNNPRAMAKAQAIPRMAFIMPAAQGLLLTTLFFLFFGH